MSDPAPLFAALDATWPAARQFSLPPWKIREGRGGGKRVTAAEASEDASGEDIAAAEQAMTALGQPCLFTLRGASGPLDALLAERGYRLSDPTLIRTCPLAVLLNDHPPPVSAFTVWEPLQIMRDIWAEGGIGPDRIAVMERVAGAKTGLFGRSANKPAGVGFVALSGDTAVVHAFEVRDTAPRLGTARNMMLAAAHWAAARGAQTMALAVTESNLAANSLYESMGLTTVSRYHYRIKE